MGVFDDKKFDGLDWISQATEPIDSHLNEILGSLPEVFPIDFELYKTIVGDHSWSIDLTVDRAVNHILRIKSHSLSWNERNTINECFSLNMEGNDVLIDFEKKEIIGGQIFLTKVVSTIDEKVLEKMLGREGLDAITNLSAGAVDLARANEILEILGKYDEAAYKSKSGQRKKYAIFNRVREIFKTNEWKIKDTGLANKVGFWIKAYVSDGDLACFSNFCRLKVMTHKEMPIYSMEEVF